MQGWVEGEFRWRQRCTLAWTDLGENTDVFGHMIWKSFPLSPWSSPNVHSSIHYLTRPCTRLVNPLIWRWRRVLAPRDRVDNQEPMVHYSFNLARIYQLDKFSQFITVLEPLHLHLNPLLKVNLPLSPIPCELDPHEVQPSKRKPQEVTRWRTMQLRFEYIAESIYLVITMLTIYLVRRRSTEKQRCIASNNISIFLSQRGVRLSFLKI